MNPDQDPQNQPPTNTSPLGPQGDAPQPEQETVDASQAAAPAQPVQPQAPSVETPTVDTANTPMTDPAPSPVPTTSPAEPVAAPAPASPDVTPPQLAEAPQPAEPTETPEPAVSSATPPPVAEPAVSAAVTNPNPFTDQNTGAANPQQPAEDPGKTLGIVGFVLSLLGGGLISLIISVVARNKSKKAGHSNGLALAGIILSVIGMIVGALLAVLVVTGAMKAAEYCQENGTTTQNADGSVSVNCSAESETAEDVGSSPALN